MICSQLLLCRLKECKNKRCLKAYCSFFFFNHCWESQLLFYLLIFPDFMAWQWYKRPSKLPKAGITISKPCKARHRCGQIRGWHRFSSLSAVEKHLQPRGSQPAKDQRWSFFHFAAIFVPLHKAALFRFSVSSLSHMPGLFLNLPASAHIQHSNLPCGVLCLSAALAKYLMSHWTGFNEPYRE